MSHLALHISYTSLFSLCSDRGQGWLPVLEVQQPTSERNLCKKYLNQTILFSLRNYRFLLSLVYNLQLQNTFSFLFSKFGVGGWGFKKNTFVIDFWILGFYTNTNNVGYGWSCNTCKNRDKMKVYEGETSQSARLRGKEHVNSYRRKNCDSVLQKQKM